LYLWRKNKASGDPEQRRRVAREAQMVLFASLWIVVRNDVRIVYATEDLFQGFSVALIRSGGYTSRFLEFRPYRASGEHREKAAQAHVGVVATDLSAI
jgi:hypothetical protein